VPGARVERPQYEHYFSDEGLVRGCTSQGHGLQNSPGT